MTVSRPGQEDFLKDSVQMNSKRILRRNLQIYKMKNQQLEKSQSKRLWHEEEDDLLKEIVGLAFELKWANISKEFNERIKQLRKNSSEECQRSNKQCRQRWQNHLNPKINNSTSWSQQEHHDLFSVFAEHSHQWCNLSFQLQKRGYKRRGDNNIKNYFYSCVKKTIKIINILIREHNKLIKKKKSELNDYGVKYAYQSRLSLERQIKKEKMCENLVKVEAKEVMVKEEEIERYISQSKSSSEADQLKIIKEIDLQNINKILTIAAVKDNSKYNVSSFNDKNQAMEVRDTFLSYVRDSNTLELQETIHLAEKLLKICKNCKRKIAKTTKNPKNDSENSLQMIDEESSIEMKMAEKNPPNQHTLFQFPIAPHNNSNFPKIFEPVSLKAEKINPSQFFIDDKEENSLLKDSFDFSSKLFKKKTESITPKMFADNPPSHLECSQNFNLGCSQNFNLGNSCDLFSFQTIDKTKNNANEMQGNRFLSLFEENRQNNLETSNNLSQSFMMMGGRDYKSNYNPSNPFNCKQKQEENGFLKSDFLANKREEPRQNLQQSKNLNLFDFNFIKNIKQVDAKPNSCMFESRCMDDFNMNMMDSPSPFGNNPFANNNNNPFTIGNVASTPRNDFFESLNYHSYDQDKFLVHLNRKTSKEGNMFVNNSSISKKSNSIKANSKEHSGPVEGQNFAISQLFMHHSWAYSENKSSNSNKNLFTSIKLEECQPNVDLAKSGFYSFQNQ